MHQTVIDSFADVLTSSVPVAAVLDVDVEPLDSLWTGIGISGTFAKVSSWAEAALSQRM
jgi:hypothetical protein